MRLSIIDKIIFQLKIIIQPNNFYKNNPATNVYNIQKLSRREKNKSIALFRINHAGEICAQALYQGQALMAKSLDKYYALLKAAAEEQNHLKWCRARLYELNGNPSILNPIWYLGAFSIGIAFGIVSDKISMAFLAETEHQVSEHLSKHLIKISSKDKKSRVILEQMLKDELRHAITAEKYGVVKLPLTVRFTMRVIAKILTVIAAKI